MPPPGQLLLQRTTRAHGARPLYRFRVVKLGERIQAHRVDRIQLSMAKQALQRLGADVSFAVPKLCKS
jgi:hypothetical protein